MVSNGKRDGERTFPYNINLPDDPNWIWVTREGLAEYISRYRTSATMSSLLEQSLYFCKDKTGDALWEQIEDAFVFSAERRGAISVSREMDARIVRLRDRLIRTSQAVVDDVRWSNRFVVAAALYVFCVHLINFKGRRILVPPNYTVSIPI